MSLYAALNTQTGRVRGKTSARHTSQEFVRFLEEVVALCPPQQEIHLIVDNLSAHKTKRVEAFSDQHRNVQLHFTPTYSSWLNQVELWFFQTATRSHCPRHLHLGPRSGPQTAPLHQRLFQGR